MTAEILDQPQQGDVSTRPPKILHAWPGCDFDDIPAGARSACGIVRQVPGRHQSGPDARGAQMCVVCLDLRGAPRW